MGGGVEASDGGGVEASVGGSVEEASGWWRPTHGVGGTRHAARPASAGGDARRSARPARGLRMPAAADGMRLARSVRGGGGVWRHEVRPRRARRGVAREIRVRADVDRVLGSVFVFFP